MSFTGRSKFKERKYSYIKKKNMYEDEDKLIIKVGKAVIYSPLILLGAIGKAIDKDNIKKDTNKIENKILNINTQNKKSNYKKENIKKENITSKQINKDNLEKKDSCVVLENNNDKSKKLSSKKLNYDYNKEMLELQQKIFIKLSKKINVLEDRCKELESEEYILNNYSSDNQIYSEAIKIKEELETIIKKIQEINDSYTILKDKELIKNPLPLDDSPLIEDIIKYRDMIKENEYKIIPKELQQLNAYTNINTILEELKTKTDNLNYIKTKRIEELLKRDKKYCYSNKRVTNIKEINDKYDQTIKEYNEYQKELLDKINNIDIKVYKEYKLKGMDNFLSITCRYLGLIALFPLKGILPQIAIETKNTRKALNTMLNNMCCEKIEKKVYKVGNYINEIDNKIYNIKSIENNLDKALIEVNKLKVEFKNEFKKYNLNEYDIAYKKILQIEKNILKNKKQIKITSKDLEDKKNQNKEILRKVKKLNS